MGIKALKFEMYMRVPMILQTFQIAIKEKRNFSLDGCYCHIFAQENIAAVLRETLEEDTMEESLHDHGLPPVFLVEGSLKDALKYLEGILGEKTCQVI